MSFSEILFLPFIFIYKGFITIILLPYYILLGITGAFKSKQKDNNISTNKSKVIPEIKKGEKIKIIKDTKSVNDKPSVVNDVKNEQTLNQEKLEKISKKQRDFDKMVEKARKEEIRKIKEQEKIRIQNEKKVQERLKKQEIKLQKEEEYELKQEEKLEKLRKEGVPTTFSEKINNLFKILAYSKKMKWNLRLKKKC